MRRPGDGDIEIGPHFVLPAEEVGEAASRASGPGGQHVNKTNTRVTLRWNVRESQAINPVQRARLLDKLRVRLTRDGDLIVHADRQRSRARNREDARRRLAQLVLEALAENEIRRRTHPSRASKLRIQKQKTVRSAVKRGRGRVSRDDH